MSDEEVRQAVQDAVGEAFDNWATEHPTLASAIDRMSLTDELAKSVRDSDEYRDAVDAYHRGLSQSVFASELLEIAREVLVRLMS